VGNGIYFDKVLDASLMRTATLPPRLPALPKPTCAWSAGETRSKPYFSYEGITWFEIGTHAIPSGFVVNGVGLTASQDFELPDHDQPADFDYFELTEGGGFLPEGYHDGNFGTAPNWACYASGWAVDPDDRDTDLLVEINVSGTFSTTLTAGDYREDLDNLGLCVGGTCGFTTDLWDQVMHYEDHTVVAYAQDIPSGDWVRLSASPKELACRTYDIYIYDTLTGVITQTTDLRNSYEWNPRWSPDGAKIVHDRYDLNWINLGVHITNVATGVSDPLTGAEDGSYPFWSPDGDWVAFNQGEDLYLLPPAGGVPTLVRADAYRASWSPDSQRLAFQQPSDGSIRTMDPDGSNVTLVVQDGNSPAWSPDGKWIAYEDAAGDLWKVRVDTAGAPLGTPIQLTSEPYWEGRATWSADSQTIAFHAGMDDDWDTDIWTIPADGGMASWLTGAPNYGDYDPNYSPVGRYLAYASFSPAGQAPRTWVSALTADLPPGSLADGSYPYHFEAQWTSPAPGTFTGQGGDFVISDQAPLYEGTVLLRGPYEIAGVDGPSGLECLEIAEINPDQPARFLMGWLTDPDMTYQQALAHFNSLTGQVLWGSSDSAVLERHVILPFSWNDTDRWYNYVCSYTRKAEPNQLFLPVMSIP
jgi:Tol biopolymer transport system component